MHQLQYLKEIFVGNKDSIISKMKSSMITLRDTESYDFVTIIPKRRRDEHLKFVLDTYQKSIEHSPYKHAAVVVEHSEYSEGRAICEAKNISYAFIPKPDKELFNKCLCMNIGSAMINSKYFMFHDIDIAIPLGFWENLKQNIGNKKVIQSFAGRRVHYITEEHTKRLFSGDTNIDVVSKKPEWFKSGRPGAPGGSIVIESDLFSKIGGFDPCYFLAYSIEDQFFVDKVSLFQPFTGCNNPPIEMFHLWHTDNCAATPKAIRDKGHKIMEYFRALPKEHKLTLIALFKNHYNIQRKTIRDNLC